MKSIVKLILFLLTFLVVAQANTPPLTSSYDLKQYDYGARYYDPRTSVWQSPDPILGEYMDGKVNTGVYKLQNLGLYTYSSNNPINRVDMNGGWDIDAWANTQISIPKNSNLSTSQAG